ncbi:MAG: thiamine phosphate synthase [Bacteroidia bacterium]|nr:thiamine phosphate synthase [Bacteroidia bacterium]
MNEPFKLIVISPEDDTEGEVDVLCKIIKLGLQLFHLRKENRTDFEIEKYINSIPVEFHNRIVLHSNFNLAQKYNLKGIHLNERNKINFENFKKFKIVSASFHSVKEIEDNKLTYEYVFLSPVFDSISKAGYKSKFDRDTLESFFNLKKHQSKSLLKVIALGGVCLENILYTKMLGFSGAAIMGGLWKTNNPVKAFLELQSKVRDTVF